MQRWGKTSCGTARWRCVHCKKNSVRSRKDIARKSHQQVFEDWVLNVRCKSDIAKDIGVHRRTLTRFFAPFWNHIPLPLPSTTRPHVLIIDGIYLESRTSCALIGKTPETVVSWVFVERESYQSWRQFCSCTPQPLVVVCDGQRGMKAAILEFWPETKIQRCMFHIIQLVTSRLTQHPKTSAGKDLKDMIYALSAVWTRRQKRRWIHRYIHWKKTYNTFLAQRTYGEKVGTHRSWWYTHRMLRSLRTLLDNAIPELFTYVGHYEIPRTTNHLEGGINSPLSELIHRHRGFSIHQKKVMVATFLLQKQTEKPTRNVP